MRIHVAIRAGAVSMLLASCFHAPLAPTTEEPRRTGGPVENPITEISKDPAHEAAQHEAALFPGTGEVVGSSPMRSVASDAGSEGFQLRFVDADIATVVASVIGDAIGAPYTIDAGVKGTITLQSTRPVGKTELLSSLEAALNTQGYALLNQKGSYRIAALKDAAKTSVGLRGANAFARPGYGIQLVPLRFIGVNDMQKILEPFAPAGAILRADEGRNVLILAGNGPELAQMLDVVKTFDVDWLAGMSFALMNLKYVDAKTAAGELGAIFADPRSPLNGIVRLIPIPRLNAILVVTPQKQYLTDVETWVKRLDLGDSSPGRRIYIYSVQNSKASDLAKALNGILALPGASTEQTPGFMGMPSTNGGAGFATGGIAAPPAGGSPGSAFGIGSQPRFGNLLGSSSATANANEGMADTGTIRIVPEDNTNSLLIMASPSEFGTIESALKRLDIPAQQVLIEASLAEVTLTKELQYGVQWSYLTSHGPIVQSQTGQISQQFPGLSYLFTGSQNIQAVLNTLETLTKVRVLSSPKLLVLNNREANLQIGEEVPIATQSAVGTITPNAPIVNSVAYRDTGVILHMTPRVNQNGLVQLDIEQEVSDVAPTTTSGINSPTINQRKISTTVSARSGETIALGGLISENVTKTKSGVPFLSAIPVLGALFGSHSTDNERTELIVLITPHIIRNEDDSRETMDMLRREFKVLPELAPQGATH